MTVQEIANRLVELCQKGDYDTAYSELFAPDAWSIEPEGVPNGKAHGVEAIKERGKQFNAMIQEMHSGYFGEATVAGNYFSVAMGMEVTFKGAPAPTKMDEIVVYEVQNGKIVKEQFFYTPEQ